MDKKDVSVLHKPSTTAFTESTTATSMHSKVNGMANDLRVIVVTFAGRQDRMSILGAYMDVAVSRRIVSEYHVWNFTRNTADDLWLQQWTAKRKGYVHLFYPEKKKRWPACYEYYVDRAAKYATAVFLKLDDDIVYLDLDKLPEFIRFRCAPENAHYWLISANVINNEMCVYCQYEQGCLDNTFPQVPYSPRGFGPVWKEGQWATRLHDHFLALPTKRFRIHKAVPIGRGDRLSINAVSWLGTDLPSMQRLKTDADDEFLLSMHLPVLLGRSNVIYGPWVVAHLSYGKQEEEDQHFRLQQIPRLIALYDRLLDMLPELNSSKASLVVPDVKNSYKSAQPVASSCGHSQSPATVSYSLASIGGTISTCIIL